jgi:hypothetical protein
MKWSREYDKCKICETTEHRHYARGLCRNCYRKELYWDNVQKERDKRKEYYGFNKDKIKAYYKDNRDKLLKYQKIYYLVQKYKGRTVLWDISCTMINLSGYNETALIINKVLNSNFNFTVPIKNREEIYCEDKLILKRIFVFI